MNGEKKMSDIRNVIIIGSGPAGSVLSWCLANKDFKISIVDRANNLKETNKNSFIYSPYIENCPDYYTPIFSNQLGGNSALWNDKVYLISNKEFNKEEWQFDYEELVKYSKGLAKKFEINHDHLNHISEIKQPRLSYEHQLFHPSPPPEGTLNNGINKNI